MVWNYVPVEIGEEVGQIEIYEEIIEAVNERRGVVRNNNYGPLDYVPVVIPPNWKDITGIPSYHTWSPYMNFFLFGHINYGKLRGYVTQLVTEIIPMNDSRTDLISDSALYADVGDGNGNLTRIPARIYTHLVAGQVTVDDFYCKEHINELYTLLNRADSYGFKFEANMESPTGAFGKTGSGYGTSLASAKSNAIADMNSQPWMIFDPGINCGVGYYGASAEVSPGWFHATIDSIGRVVARPPYPASTYSLVNGGGILASVKPDGTTMPLKLTHFNYYDGLSTRSVVASLGTPGWGSYTEQEVRYTRLWKDSEPTEREVCILEPESLPTASDIPDNTDEFNGWSEYNFIYWYEYNFAYVAPPPVP